MKVKGHVGEREAELVSYFSTSYCKIKVYLMDPIMGVLFVASLATNDGKEWLI